MIGYFKKYNYFISPILIGVICLIASIKAINFYDQSWKDRLLSSLNKMGVSNCVYLTRQIEKSLSAAYIMGSLIKQNNGNIDKFDEYAKDIYSSFRNITNIQLAPNGIIEKIYPLEGHESALGHDLIHDDKRKKEAKLAIETKKLTLAGPFNLIQGGEGIIGRYPIFISSSQNEEKFWGFSSVLIYLEDVIVMSGLDNLSEEYEYQLKRLHPDTSELEVIAGETNLSNFQSDEFSVAVPNGEWFLTLAMKQPWTHAPFYNAGISLAYILSTLVALLLFYILRQPLLLQELVNTKTEQLRKLALYDSLTGLYNRYEFESRVNSVLKRIHRDNTQHVLCYMDLDQFKIVNDTCGHVAGDELLKRISALINNKIRESDILARLGGDEFGILFENCSVNDAQRIMDTIRQDIHDYRFHWKNKIFRVGVSIGLIKLDNKISDINQLLSLADTACYVAKDKGRNRIHVYTLDDGDIAQQFNEMQWTTRIHEAIKNNRFCLCAQPIEPTLDEEKFCYEILLRMEDEDGSIIYPDQFIPSAERYGLMEEIDMWVINETFKNLAAFPNFLQNIKYVSINLSGYVLSKDNMLEYIVESLKKHHINGEKICFEITETAAVSNIQKAEKFINALKKHQCSFALDDFGSGLSSFAYLKSLSVDYLKIDGLFVKNMDTQEMDYAMVKSINEIGQILGLKTIAEFVENNKIKAMLKLLGVNYAQGYAISKPIEFELILNQSLELEKKMFE